ncbi:MAG: ATP-binding protein [Lachnospiraceae bacterium]|nr:ATP-binding protein [Lachnospiraceae bacterium]
MEHSGFYMRRKADLYLAEWKANPRKLPLVVKGARQIGKTETILHFARLSYENIVYINFVVDEKFRIITKDGYEPQNIIKNITLVDSSKKFIPHKTLIIFDELQEYPEIATSLKFFKTESLYDVICSGSLLGISYSRIQSNSVGYKTDYEMSSLDFEEFLWAKGYNGAPSEMLEKMKAVSPFSELELKIYSSLFRDFCITGGMPAIVSSYVQKGTFEGVLEMQRQLIQNYKEDAKKYAEGLDKTRIIHVLDHIPVQLAKENKKFQISKVARGARFKDYWGCIEWLKEAGIVNVCYCMNFPELPLKGNYDASKYKLYFFDTGLLVANLDEDAQNDLRVNENLGVYKGALYENIIAESLRKQEYELYYYKKEDSTLEEDFFVRAKNYLIPVEVKATNGTAKSLRTLLQNDHYADIKYGIKFIQGNNGYSNSIFTFPYFCSFLLKRYLQDFTPPVSC